MEDDYANWGVKLLTTLYLIRHAQSARSKNLIESQWPLSKKGQLQSLAMIKPLSALKPTKIVSSPYVRAYSTVEPFSKFVNISIEIDPMIRERKFSNALIHNFLEVMEKAWLDFDFSLPGCESGNSAQSRALEFIYKICQTHPKETIFLSSHGNLIGLILNALDPSFGFHQWQKMKNPDVYKLRYADNNLHWDKDFVWQEPAIDQRVFHDF